MKIQNNKTKKYIKIGIFGAVILLIMMTVPTISNTIQNHQMQVYAQTTANTNVNNSQQVDGDEKMADIEKDIPGFGGVFMDKNKVLNVYVVSSKVSKTQTDSEKSAHLEKHLGKGHLSKGMIILEGKYTFTELRSYKQKLSPLLDQKMNVTAVGIDDSKNLVMIGVEKISDAGLVIKELSNLGVPREAVDIVETGKITLDNHDQKHRPVTGGVRLEFFFDSENNGQCSVGMSADRGGSRVTVTAGHCSLASDRNNIYFYQNQCCDSTNGMGSEISGTNPIQQRYSDTLLISPTVSTSKGVVHRDNGGDVTLMGKQYIDVVGDSITKSGFNTSDTTGVITKRCVLTNSTTYGKLYCQDYASYTSGAGDSGGTVYGIDINSGTYKWYGTHWGEFSNGTRIFSTVQDIENDQGTLDIGPSASQVSPATNTFTGSNTFTQAPTLNSGMISQGNIVISHGICIGTCFTISGNPPACVPPLSGDWNVTSSCTLSSSATAPANVIISPNAALTIPNGLTLTINFGIHHLLVKPGGQVYIQPNGKVSS